MERQIDSAKESAEESKQNQAFPSEIQSGEISDRILNPLTTIKGFLELNKHYQLDSILLNLLLKEIKEIEDSVVYFETRLNSLPKDKTKKDD